MPQSNQPATTLPTITVTAQAPAGMQGTFLTLNGWWTSNFEGANIYRAVSQAEFSDILGTGQFRNLPGMGESKYFTNSAENAALYGQKATEAFGDSSYTVVGGDAPQSVLQGSDQFTTADLPGGLPTYTIPNGELPFVEPVFPGWVVF